MRSICIDWLIEFSYSSDREKELERPTKIPPEFDWVTIDKANKMRIAAYLTPVLFFLSIGVAFLESFLSIGTAGLTFDAKAMAGSAGSAVGWTLPASPEDKPFFLFTLAGGWADGEGFYNYRQRLSLILNIQFLK